MQLSGAGNLKTRGIEDDDGGVKTTERQESARRAQAGAPSRYMGDPPWALRRPVWYVPRYSRSIAAFGKPLFVACWPLRKADEWLTTCTRWPTTEGAVCGGELCVGVDPGTPFYQLILGAAEGSHAYKLRHESD